MRALTANRLTDGEVGVLERRPVGSTLRRGASCSPATTRRVAEAAIAKACTTVVVEPYLIDVIQAEGPGRRSATASASARSAPPTSSATASRPRAAPTSRPWSHADGAARSTGRVDLIKRK